VIESPARILLAMPPRKKARAAVSLKDVTVKVDASLKKRWDALSARLDAAAHEGATAFDVLWEVADEIVSHAPPLYVVGGYKSDAEFFMERMKTDRRAAWRFIRVARFATPLEEERYGTSKLDAALGYLEAKTGHALAGALPVAFDRLRITVGKGAKARSVSLEQATVADIQAATRALLAKGKGGAPKTPARDALESALGEIGSLADVTVRERGGLLSFLGVPVAALDVFASAILRGAPKKAATRKTPAKARKTK
jgi:hypothetical protein